MIGNNREKDLISLLETLKDTTESLCEIKFVAIKNTKCKMEAIDGYDKPKKATVFVYSKINILRNELSQGQCILMTVYKGPCSQR